MIKVTFDTKAPYLFLTRTLWSHVRIMLGRSRGSRSCYHGEDVPAAFPACGKLVEPIKMLQTCFHTKVRLSLVRSDGICPTALI
jgi:hypothetical protein